MRERKRKRRGRMTENQNEQATPQPPRIVQEAQGTFARLLEEDTQIMFTTGTLDGDEVVIMQMVSGEDGEGNIITEPAFVFVDSVLFDRIDPGEGIDVLKSVDGPPGK